MNYDVIIVGGGYVGIEVVVAVVCSGVWMVLVSFDLMMIGVMLCNFVIGGLGKGYLVCEVDVFDGLIGCVLDVVVIYYWMFNWLKGLAV